MTEFVARLRGLGRTPRKIRPLLDLIRGKPLIVAKAILKASPKRGGEDLIKVLKNAESRAKDEGKKTETLFVIRAEASDGPKLRRAKPRSRGRIFPFLRRRTHLEIALGEGAKPVFREK